MWKKSLKKKSGNWIAEPNAALLRTLHSLTLRSFNKRVSGSGFQPSPKLPSVASDTCNMLSDIRFGGVSIDLKGWNQLCYRGESNHEPEN